MDHKIKTAIVGAGNISGIHVRILNGLPDVEIAAVVDRDLARAQKLASHLKVDIALDEVGKLIELGLCDAAHVLVPPNAHRSVGEALLRAGVHVLMEKPLATTVADCTALQDAAASGGACLSVNQNLIHNPTYLKAKEAILSGRLGGLRHVISVWNVPLAPLNAKKFGLWMFREPQNIVLEQAVHPLSGLLDLGGEVQSAQCLTGDPIELEEGLSFYPTWQVSLALDRASAQLFYSVGQSYDAERLLAICDDGVVEVDFVANQVVVGDRSVAQEPMAGFTAGWSKSTSVLNQSLGAFTDITLKDLRLRKPGDAYLQSMQLSIGGFYQGLRRNKSFIDSRFGKSIVSVCSDITRAAQRASNPIGSHPQRATPMQPCDFVLFGGSGFIGQHLVRGILEEGYTCRVVTRNTGSVPRSLRTDSVQLLQGDISVTDPADFMRDARFVADLVLPDGDDTFDAIVESAQRIARASLKAGVDRLVYLSSIVALNMGDPGETLVGSTGPIPNVAGFDPYGRGKAEAERIVGRLAASEGLPVCILRPGIVVGVGGTPYHGGIGRFVNEQHCVGYSGNAPMPFVLVEEMADSIIKAATRPEAAGKVYNVVGDVRLSAYEYVDELGKVLGRPLQYHLRNPGRDFAENVLRWAVKRVVGRRDSFPSYTALKSMTFAAKYDCSDIKNDLQWSPNKDRARFIERAVNVHQRAY